MFRDLRELLANTEKKYADEVAFRLKFRNEIVGVKYSKFIEDIKGLGSYLLTLDMQNRRIAFISNNRYEWCVTYLATATANLISVPIDKSLPINEFESLMKRAEADVLIYDIKHEEYAELLKNNTNSSVKHFVFARRKHFSSAHAESINRVQPQSQSLIDKIGRAHV